VIVDRSQPVPADQICGRGGAARKNHVAGRNVLATSMAKHHIEQFIAPQSASASACAAIVAVDAASPNGPV